MNASHLLQQVTIEKKKKKKEEMIIINKMQTCTTHTHEEAWSWEHASNVAAKLSNGVSGTKPNIGSQTGEQQKTTTMLLSPNHTHV